jgi:outer membrane lipoprotein-sorting protein
VLVDYAKKDEQEVLLNNFLYEIKDHYFAQIVEETKEKGAKIYVLRLTPKPAEQSIFTSIKVWIKDKSWEIERLVYTDYNDNETEYQIDRIDFNPDLAESTFTFSPPEGIQVIDLRL